MKINLCGVVCRVEFDGDVSVCLAPAKSTFLSTSIDSFDVFCNVIIRFLSFRNFFFFIGNYVFHDGM